MRHPKHLGTSDTSGRRTGLKISRRKRSPEGKERVKRNAWTGGHRARPRSLPKRIAVKLTANESSRLPVAIKLDRSLEAVEHIAATAGALHAATDAEPHRQKRAICLPAWSFRIVPAFGSVASPTIVNQSADAVDAPISRARAKINFSM